MKLFTLILISILYSSLAEASSQNRIAWTLLYGQATNQNVLNYSPTGPAYKIMFGGRVANFDFNLLIRLVNLSDKFTYAQTEGNLKYKNLTSGLQLGYWILPFLNLHSGYARHDIQDKIQGNFTTNQLNELTTKYKIEDKKTGGLYAGADLVLLQSKSIQFFVNYDYYRLNQMSSNDWEVMGGFRFYIDSADSSDGVFKKLFQKMFGTN